MRTEKALIVIGGVVAIGVAALAITRRPMVFSFTDPGELQRPSISILNPFRDRAPERVAETFLLALRRGDHAAAFNQVVPREIVSADIREKEREYRLQRWKLVKRHDAGDEVVLFYRAARVTPERLDSPLIIAVKGERDRWVITTFSPVY